MKEHERITSNKICPECKNFLEYWVSDDFYFKGTKFYKCDVCKWTPEDLKKDINKCPNGCGNGTVCSDCPPK